MCKGSDVHFLIKVGVKDSGEVVDIVSWWSASVQSVLTPAEEALLSAEVHQLSIDLASVLERAAGGSACAEGQKRGAPLLL